MSTFDRLTDLPLEVESCSLEGLSAQVSSAFDRLTTVVRLRGVGFDGIGEDVVYDAVDHTALQDAGPVQKLAAETTALALADAGFRDVAGMRLGRGGLLRDAGGMRPGGGLVRDASGRRGRVGLFLAGQGDDRSGVILPDLGQVVELLPCSDFEARPLAPEIDAGGGANHIGDVGTADARGDFKEI